MLLSPDEWSILNQENQPSKSNFTACQNSLSEHSFSGVPASLYKPTKSVPHTFQASANSDQNSQSSRRTDRLTDRRRVIQYQRDNNLGLTWEGLADL